VESFKWKVASRKLKVKKLKSYKWKVEKLDMPRVLELVTFNL
jgi:hypothetical protein